MKYITIFAFLVSCYSCSKSNVNPSSTDQTATSGTYGNYFFYDSLVWNGHSIGFLSTIDSGVAYPDFDSCTVWASGKQDTLTYSIKTTYKTVPSNQIVCQMTLNNKIYKYTGSPDFNIGGAEYGDTIKAVYVNGLTPMGSLTGMSLNQFTLYQAFNIPVRFAH